MYASCVATTSKGKEERNNATYSSLASYLRVRDNWIDGVGFVLMSSVSGKSRNSYAKIKVQMKQHFDEQLKLPK